MIEFLLLWLATDPWIVSLILSHKATAGLIGYSVFSAVVDGMPAPDASSGRAYRWLYGTLHAAALNLFTAVAVFFPRIAQMLGRLPASSAPEESPARNPTRGRIIEMPAREPQDPSNPAA